MEIIGERWTILIVRELIHGGLSFNKLRNGVPMMSPSLLSTRLKFLEHSGIVARKKTDKGIQYFLTDAGVELKPIIIQMGIWGQRWARSDMSKKDLDPRILMWDIKRRIDTKHFPRRRVVLLFEFTNYISKFRFWWLVVDKKDVDVCLKDPGHDVDLVLATDLKTMSSIWMGDLKLQKAIELKLLDLHGSRDLQRNIFKWFSLNTFSSVKSALLI